MGFFEKILEKISKFQAKHYGILFTIILIFSTIMLIGVPKIRMESDMQKSMPQDMEIYKLNDRVNYKFGGQDVILVPIAFDNDNNFRDVPKDIRSVEIIRYVSALSKSLESESSIESVTSIGSVFSSMSNYDQNTVDYILDSNPALNQFFSKDYTSTFLMVKSDIGSSEERVKAITDLIESKIDTISKPAGTKIMITGNPPMRSAILEILFSDAKKTILLASILIFILLLFMERSFIRSVLIFTPLMLGLVWTIGTMGWLGLEISVATAGLGAMILGLGVEYGVFMLMRYLEMKEKGHSPEESIIKSVPASGIAILGSGLTTMVGFFALALSVLPMLQKLGISLGIGITYCLISAIIVAPVIFIVSEKLVVKLDEKMYLFFKKKHETKDKF